MGDVVKFASAESEAQVINRGGYQEVTVFKGEDNGQLVFAPATVRCDAIWDLVGNLEEALERLKVLEEEVRREQEVKVIPEKNEGGYSRGIEIYEPFKIKGGRIIGIERQKPWIVSVTGMRIDGEAWDANGRIVMIEKEFEEMIQKGKEK